MIDFVKLWITDYKSIKKLWANPLLYFNIDLTKLNQNTGELENIKIKHFEGIEFKLQPYCPKNEKIKKERLEIRFKPHYWYNDNLHNANDFTPNQARYTIQRFIDLFNIEHPEHFEVVNLEYGPNFTINGYGKELISFPSYHSKDELVRDIEHKYSKKKGSSKYLTIKLYSKGVQFPEHCPGNTIRFEVKSRRSKRIKPLGIDHLGDLLKETPYHKMKADIIENAERVFIIDPYPIYQGLTTRQENKLKEYTNPSFWFKELQGKREDSFYEKKKTYLGYLDKTGNNINRKFVKSIEQKLTQLFNENRINSAPLEKTQNRINSPMLKGKSIPLSYSRVCPITGIDISMQKEGSKLLSNTGLKHLEKTDKKKFGQLTQTLLTGHHNEFEKTVYDKMSKQIRNRYYNRYQEHRPEQTKLPLF